MEVNDSTLTAHQVDGLTYAISIAVPPPKVALLQGYFELYEGVGTVRTYDVKKSLVCIFTTGAFVQDCIQILTAIREEVDWRITLETGI